MQAVDRAEALRQASGDPDPGVRRQAAIALGGNLWDDKGAGFTTQVFLDRVRAKASELATR